jgi:hypothetical protein
MILSNFEFMKVVGTGLDEIAFAKVDVTTTTGSWWWKRTTTQRVSICREKYLHWYFADTGEHTPGLQVERLEKAWKAARASVQK